VPPDQPEAGQYAERMQRSSPWRRTQIVIVLPSVPAWPCRPAAAAQDQGRQGPTSPRKRDLEAPGRDGADAASLAASACPVVRRFPAWPGLPRLALRAGCSGRVRPGCFVRRCRAGCSARWCRRLPGARRTGHRRCGLAGRRPPRSGRRVPGHRRLSLRLVVTCNLLLTTAMSTRRLPSFYGPERNCLLTAGRGAGQGG
jgi:hypothetical protein